MGKSLAVKYRPQKFSEVTEQGSVVAILTQQISNNDIRNAYLFVGAAGTGKTTCARIFANEINHGQGNPVELDAASNNSVDNIREIEKLAGTMSMTSEYKVFILDEVHALSNSAFQAMLKLIEEPPAKSIFILCTTDPQKIPKTILSRCQRYNFQRISKDGIVSRLTTILAKEGIEQLDGSLEAVEYIARLSEGGMRDAIQLLDKCLAYSEELTVENVIEALGLSNYDTLMDLTDNLIDNQTADAIDIIETEYSYGVDMKQFIRTYLNFILDAKKAIICGNLVYTSLPDTEDIGEFIKGAEEYEYVIDNILDMLVELNANIKYDQSPKYLIEAAMLRFEGRER